MKRFLIALNIVIWSIVAVEANAKEVQVPNYPDNSKKMFLMGKLVPDTDGTVYGVFRTSGWKSGVDSFTVVQVDCKAYKIKDVGYGEGSVSNVKDYPAHTVRWMDPVGSPARNPAGYEGSFAYNRFRAICG